MKVQQKTEQGYEVLDTITGEITMYTVKPITDERQGVKPTRAKECPYLRWESSCRTDTVGLQKAVDAITHTMTLPTRENACTVHTEQVTTDIDPIATGAKRGPKPTVKENPLHAYMTTLYEGGYDWFDDICYGAMNIKECGRSSSGEYNCSFSLVNRAMFLPVITTEAVRGFVNVKTDKPVSVRTSEYVAAAARTAVSGIEHFLIRNPDVWAKVKADHAMEESLAYNPHQTLHEGSTDFGYTRHQLDLKHRATESTGDVKLSLLLEYGESVRDMRLRQNPVEQLAGYVTITAH